jgi:hypothetical protein
MRQILVLALVISFGTVQARQTEPGDSTVYTDITPAVAAALRTGNAAALAEYFNATIDLTLPGSEGTYSKSQAELIVKAFFSANKPEEFEIQHQGSSGEGSQFCIGTLTTDNGDFRTYFLVKSFGKQSLITQLQFEEE